MDTSTETWQTLAAKVQGGAAGALLVQQDPDAGAGDALACRGLGLGDEPADRDPALPLRADGLASGIRAALAESRLVLARPNPRATAR